MRLKKREKKKRRMWVYTCGRLGLGRVPSLRTGRPMPSSPSFCTTRFPTITSLSEVFLWICCFCLNHCCINLFVDRSGVSRRFNAVNPKWGFPKVYANFWFEQRRQMVPCWRLLSSTSRNLRASSCTWFGQNLSILFVVTERYQLLISSKNYIFCWDGLILLQGRFKHWCLIFQLITCLTKSMNH